MSEEASVPAAPATDLEVRLAEAEQRAFWATTRVGELQAEIQRLNDWRRITVGAVVAVALFAILMFGIVAFKIADTTDDSDARRPRAVGVQLTERVVPRQ